MTRLALVLGLALGTIACNTSDPEGPDGGSAPDLIGAPPVDGTRSELSAAGDNIVADKTDFTKVRVVARAANGEPLSGRKVMFMVTGSGNVLVQTELPTGDDGIAEGSLESSVAEAKSLTATIDGVALTQAVTVTFVAGPAAQLAWSVQPMSGGAGMPLAPAPVVAIQDALGNVLPGANGAVAVTIGSNPSGGVLSGDTVAMATAGIAHFNNLRIDKVGANYTLFATLTGVPMTNSASFAIAVGSPSGSTSTVMAAPLAGIVADGAQSSVIDVTVRDDQGNPIGNIGVTLSCTGTGNTFTQPPETDSFGHTTGFLRSTRAEAKDLTAVAKGITLDMHPTITFTPGAVSASMSTVMLSVAELASDGIAQSMVTVHVVDASGNPIEGAAVVLTANGANNLFAQPTMTDPNGDALGAISSTMAQVEQITATVDGVTPLDDQPTVTFDP